uniref:Acyl-CoA synthetase n=1 Tax=Thermosporothrix sp. COM3 TaxID=2490863 RepID=A0A455SP78_9CHLR|nr:acyl-CoA synthetase [Thermosporothrix sp. COM3]
MYTPERQAFPNTDITNLVALMRWRATVQPDDIACTFMNFKADEKNDDITYRHIDAQARAIAAHLQALGLSGKSAILLYPSGLPYITAFFACLYARVLAIPAYPPHSERFVPRIQAIVQDSEATIILTTTQIKANVKRWFAGVPALEHLQWLTTDDISIQAAGSWKELDIEARTLAFLQYTSGSTSAPKGVMVSHGNLLHNLKGQANLWHIPDEPGCYVSWLPIFHDMGLIAGILLPFYLGSRVYLMAPASFLQRPMRWLQTISRYHATHSFAPNFGYELCARRSTPESRAGLDLSNWRVAMNGAEPIHHDTLENFLRVFAPYGFRRSAFAPAYGLAEATLVVSSISAQAISSTKTVNKSKFEQRQIVEVEPTSSNIHRAVSCGRVLDGQKVRIVHPETRTTCPDGIVGEIWVAGPSNAHGYWQRPTETETTFHAYLTENNEGPFLRTGDLGFLQDGELFLVGRLKDVIIIRGRNFYPQDIEVTVENAHPAIRLGTCAAFSIEEDNQEQLVIVAEVDHRYQAKEGEPEQEKLMQPSTIQKRIREAVALEHDVQVAHIGLLKVGGIQKTSSGKIQRSACRAKFLDGSLSLWSGLKQQEKKKENIYG